MNPLPEVSQISVLGHWNLISEAEWERKSSTWGEIWLMQKLKWWSRRCYYEDPEVFKDLLVERQKPGLFSLERLLHIEALSAGWDLGRLVSSLLACSVSSMSAAVQQSQELNWRQHTVDLSLINRRSVKTWNAAAFFPATETLMIFFSTPPGGAESMNELKEAPMCLSSWKAPCFDGALMDFSKDSVNALPSSIGNSYVLKLAPCHVYLCSIFP